jgi:hydroxymethylpyrimidine kinase/phosphomethylpyrimidine kinase
MEATAVNHAPVALCLGGLDPSAGAGILRDAATCQALGVHAMAICTAETVQNSLGCQRIVPPLLDPVEHLETLSVHLAGAWGLKVGLCALDLPSFRRLAAALESLAPPIRIWDPIVAPSLGVPLHDVHELRVMADVLLPMGGWVVAPNLHEASVASGKPIEAGPEALASPFLERGAAAVWLKGGHRGLPEVEDFWIDAAGARSIGRWVRMQGERRGTGCTIASAWLAHRIRGLGDLPAVVSAVEWIRSRWDPAYLPGDVGRPMFPPGDHRC